MAEDEDLSDKIPPDKEEEITAVTSATTKEENETEDSGLSVRPMRSRSCTLSRK